MNVSSVGASATQVAQAKTANAVQLPAPKQAVDAPAHGVMNLVQSASLERTSNPPHLGQKVDTFA